MPIPHQTDRYAVVSIDHEFGPGYVTFWRDHAAAISLLTRYVNCAWSTSQGVSVWYRRTATSQWNLITDTQPSTY